MFTFHQCVNWKMEMLPILRITGLWDFSSTVWFSHAESAQTIIIVNNTVNRIYIYTYIVYIIYWVLTLYCYILLPLSLSLYLYIYLTDSSRVIRPNLMDANHVVTNSDLVESYRGQILWQICWRSPPAFPWCGLGCRERNLPQVGQWSVPASHVCPVDLV